MRVVIAEDSVILRDGLVRLLTAHGHHVVTAVDNADALLSAVTEHSPEICIVDVRMPPTHTDEGLMAALTLRRTHPEVGVLVFSQYVEFRYAEQLLAGSLSSVGYLLKDRIADIRDFLEAVERVANGGTALDPEVIRQLFSAPRRQRQLQALTPREREVLELIAEGRSNKAIATALVITGGAVEKHISNIFTKLDLSTGPDDHRRVLAVLRYLHA